jgi:hypothetical protein
MEDVATLSHTPWDCKYHVVYTPKSWRKAHRLLWALAFPASPTAARRAAGQFVRGGLYSYRTVCIWIQATDELPVSGKDHHVAAYRQTVLG